MKELTLEPEPIHGHGHAHAQTIAPSEIGKGNSTTRPDLHNRAVKILRAREAYNGGYNDEVGEKPSRFEVFGWYLYEFCFYFVQTVLVPIVFPLIISQLQKQPTVSLQEWNKIHPGTHCSQKEFHLYSKLTGHTISSKFLPLEWTSIAWAIGLAVAAPILGFLSFHLDGNFPKLITVAATGVGVFFCLPAGFFKVTAIFIPYIAGIIAASTVTNAAHTQHFGLMIPAFTGTSLKRKQFFLRQGVSTRLSLYATSAGCFGGALIAAFTYHMIHELNDNERDVMSLWVVSIFSGLIWLVGILHLATATSRTTDSISFSSRLHPFSIFKYPHAIGGLASVFLASFTMMTIFTGGVIFIVGQLCIRPLYLLLFGSLGSSSPFCHPDSDSITDTVTGNGDTWFFSAPFRARQQELHRLRSIAAISDDSFFSPENEYQPLQASQFLNQYIAAIADELKGSPLVVSVLDGSTLRLLFEDEDDFAMLAENLFTELDVEDKGKISKSEIRNALVQMGVDMEVPPFSEYPQLNNLLSKHGADGEEELGQAQFAQLLQFVLQDLEVELSKKNFVFVQNIQIINGSKIRQLLANEKELNSFIEKASQEKLNAKDGLGST
ncbi:hypothetical protein RYX36_010437 [Vicia faba]